MTEGVDTTKAEAYARRFCRARLGAIGPYMVKSIRQNIGILSRTISFRKTGGGKYMRMLGPRGSNRSLPGEFPHKDTGALWSSITYERVSDSDTEGIRVGSSVKHSLFLEMGTRKIAARPFLRRTLKEESGAILQLAAGNQQTPELSAA